MRWLLNRSWPLRMPFSHGAPPRYKYLDVIRAEYKFYTENVAEGATVIDVGANTGEITALLSKLCGTSGQVFCFEPIPPTFDRLQRVITALGRTNVTLECAAVASETKTQRLNYYGEGHTTLSSKYKSPEAHYRHYSIENVYTVPTVRLDDYVYEKKINTIDLLKIDVEGQEWEVLQGAKKMFEEKKVRTCIFEVGHTTFEAGVDPNQFIAFFSETKYRLRNLMPKVSLLPINPEGKPIYGMIIAEK